MTNKPAPFSNLVHPSSGNTAKGLLQNFALAEVKAHLPGSQNERNNALRAANVSLALAMEKFVYYRLLEENPSMQRRSPETDSVDMGYSSAGEKLYEVSLVRTGFFALDQDGELADLIPTNFVCDHTGISVALPEQTEESYELGRFRNPVSVEHAFQEYTMRIGRPDISFEDFEALQIEALRELIDAQPALENVS